MSRFKGLNAYDLHKHLINEYVLTQRGSTKVLSRDTSKDKTDYDVIRENHQFLWDDAQADTWEKQLAKKYYDKLFKEYCICDLSRYKENKIALRWRTEQEVISGKGQFACGHKKCTVVENLKSWEVNFAYAENKETKNALVKLRLCVDCSAKLNYHTKKREVKRLKRSRKSSYNNDGKSIDNPPKEDELPSTSNTDEDMPVDNQTKDAPNVEPWKKGNVTEEKSREEEFESYLEDLLL